MKMSLNEISVHQRASHVTFHVIFFKFIICSYFSFSTYATATLRPQHALILLSGNSCSLVPWEVDAIILDALHLLPLGRCNEPLPALLFAVLDGLFFRIEFYIHVGQGIAWRWPAHEWILPAFTVVEVDSPELDVVGSALHGVLWRNEDANATSLDVLVGNAVDGREAFLKD